MKRAKIVMATLALLAVIGGIFAFKAQNFTPLGKLVLPPTFSSTLPGGVYSTTTLFCPTTILRYVTNVNPGGQVATTTFTTGSGAGTTTLVLTHVGNGNPTTITAYASCEIIDDVFTTNVQ